MNDEFLYRLRKDPPPEFAARLKARLDLQPRPWFATRSSLLRSVIVALLVGGSVLAVTWLMTKTERGRIFQSLGAADRIPASRAVAPPPPSMPDDGQMLADLPPARASHLPIPAVATKPRERVHLAIVSSRSTAALASAVAKAIAKDLPQPQLVVPGGTRVIQAFCGGIEDLLPNVAVTTSRITPEELAACRRGGVRRIIEAQLGYQAVIVTASRTGPSFKLTPRDIYLAVAKQIPDPSDPTRLIDNPNRTWDQVNPALESWRIQVLGPRADSVAREAFAGLVLEAGCDTFAWIEALRNVDEQRHRRICHTLREDGAFIEAAAPETSTAQTLMTAPETLAIVDYEFYERSRYMLAGSLIRGIEPTMENIASGAYKPSRPLYLYFNGANALATRGAWQFIHGVLSEASVGPSGYLTREGLIPLDEAQRQATRADVQQFKEVTL